MVDSINTNAGALNGLRQLQATRESGATTRSQISSGRDVNSAEDNAAIFSIAQRERAEISGLNASQQSLDRALSTSDVALAASSQVGDLLGQLRERAVAAADPGLDQTSREALNREFTQLRDQIGTTLENAGFNGTNPLVSGGGDIAAITDANGENQLTIPEQDLSLGGGNIPLAQDSSIATAADAQAAVGALDTGIENLNTVSAELGAGANRLEQSRTFNTLRSDTTEVGVGNLVDSNLAEDAANLAANQVREELGIQAQNIANRQPATLLQLFNG
ncbi:flagellin [Yunchengibacter salinarum]|uniref:flagellin n=1 Tax=Yunchengibacter salinarum TaxID=3133399 RepID=UPI0035B5ACBA